MVEVTGQVKFSINVFGIFGKFFGIFAHYGSYGFILGLW